jgi:nucleotide-binding universal stress UspA family protein
MNWARSSSLEIQPVHILAFPNDAADEYPKVAGIKRYITAAEKAAERYLQDLGVFNARPVKVLLAGSSARREEVRDLLDYAEEQNARCIIVSSHGRSGVRRLFLGSFSENLLLQSVCPVVFLTHFENADDHDKKITRALFATDFSGYSREAFIRFLSEARRSHLDLTLFHSVFLPAATLGTGFGAPVVISERYFPEQVKWAKREASRWAKLAESFGVHIRLIIKEEGVGPNIAETILEVAEKEGAGLVAMASVSGAVTSFVLGSVAREVFRMNRCPVWIYGPRSLEDEPHIKVISHAVAD